MFKEVYKLLWDILPRAFIMALTVIAIIAFFPGPSFIGPFILGFALSCLNFVLLVLSSHLIVGSHSNKSRNYYTTFFLLRCTLMFVVISFYVYSHKNTIVMVAIGLMIINLSIALNAFAQHFAQQFRSRKER